MPAPPPPYDETKDDGYWGLRETLAYFAGARGDAIRVRYPTWRATPRPGVGGVVQYWKGLEHQAGFLLFGGHILADELAELAEAARDLARYCSRATNPLIAIGRTRDGTSRRIEPVEWPDLILIDAGAGPEIYWAADATQAALGARAPAFSNVRFPVADVLRAVAGPIEATAPEPRPTEEQVIAFFCELVRTGKATTRDPDVKAARAEFGGAFKRDALRALRSQALGTNPAK
jgi:hypothetical protein